MGRAEAAKRRRVGQLLSLILNLSSSHPARTGVLAPSP